MQFMIFSEDKPDSLSIRQNTRDAHLAWLKTDDAATVLVAGPWFDENGDMRGSMLVVETDSRAALDGWMARDPYARAGLPGTVIVKPYKWVIGAPSPNAS